ncbi:MAG: methyltransferase domain-containing protein [Gemmatimonadota bacterium]|nr:methyltransferase domain-containing protein [Gemmatimonadota bacterium]
MTPSDRIAHYYDRNTRRFLRFGGGGEALAIHRELWGPDVRTPAEAKRYVNRLLGHQIAAWAPDAPTVLDLGCGVGGTLFDLANRFDHGRFHGVTISPQQQRLAERTAKRKGLAERCRFHVGDFEDPEPAPPLGTDRVDVVVAVESFAHSACPQALFRTVARHFESRRGRLIVVDDFLTRSAKTLKADERRLVDTFRRGWRLGTVMDPRGWAEAAEPAGFELLERRDLTPLIRLGRPRDRAIALVAPVLTPLGLARVPFFGNMIGGNALQQGLTRGVFSYGMLTFDFAGSSSHSD